MGEKYWKHFVQRTKSPLHIQPLVYLGTSSWFSRFPRCFNGLDLVCSLRVLLHYNTLRFAFVHNHTQRPVGLGRVKDLHKHTKAHT